MSNERKKRNVSKGRSVDERGLGMKMVLVKVLIWPLELIITILESLLKLVIKIATVASGLLINILLICIVISICAKQWISLSILIVAAFMDIGLIYGHAILLYYIGETKEFLQRRS